MEFAKLHGLGNDFLIAKAGEAGFGKKPLPHLAKAVCDRHLGVGADGIVFYQPTTGDKDAEVSALIFNADGSRAEMSGNGVRCLAAWLRLSGECRRPSIRIRTVAGVRVLKLESHTINSCAFECSMGRPIVEPRLIPVLLGEPDRPLLDYPLGLGNGVLKISASSFGNPHCTTFWEDVGLAPLESLGRELENHSAFPNKTNVEFVQIIDEHRLKVRFWERGVGPTLASGTGSSAAAVAAILSGRAQSPMAVEAQIGSMSVRWDPPGELYLSGPAQLICTGMYFEDESPATP